jgi:hypothetical protein
MFWIVFTISLIITMICLKNTYLKTDTITHGARPLSTTPSVIYIGGGGGG